MAVLRKAGGYSGLSWMKIGVASKFEFDATLWNHTLNQGGFPNEEEVYRTIDRF
jgi:hypothetical protein